MRSLAVRLGDAINQQAAEVARLRDVATKDLAAAEEKLAVLMKMAQQVTPDLEVGYATLRSVGISLDSD